MQHVRHGQIGCVSGFAAHLVEHIEPGEAAPYIVAVAANHSVDQFAIGALPRLLLFGGAQREFLSVIDVRHASPCAKIVIHYDGRVRLAIVAF